MSSSSSPAALGFFFRFIIVEKHDVEKRITIQMGQTIGASGPTQTRLTRCARTRRTSTPRTSPSSDDSRQQSRWVCQFLVPIFTLSCPLSASLLVPSRWRAFQGILCVDLSYLRGFLVLIDLSVAAFKLSLNFSNVRGRMALLNHLPDICCDATSQVKVRVGTSM